MVDGMTGGGKPLHPVLAVLQARTACGSKPGMRADDFKVGLAIEGGGMRGVLSAGMVAALKYLGLQDAIDVVYGSSAGSIIGAYFVSGQGPLYGASIYYDSICSDRFISKRALLSSPYLLGRSGRAVTDASGNKVRPVLYLDALLDEVMKETKPLDWDAFARHAAKQPLKPVASSLTAMRSEILDGFSTLDELLDCLRASARVPGIAGDPVFIDGAYYSDAMIFEPVPYRSALADGCTHVLVLRTKPETSRLPARPGIYEALIAAPYFNRNPDSPCPAAARFVLDGKHIGIYKEAVEDLRRRRSGWVEPTAAGSGGGGGGWVFDVVPAWDSKEVAQLETRSRIIYNGARNGFAAAYEALSPFATPSSQVYGTVVVRGGGALATAGRPTGPSGSAAPRPRGPAASPPSSPDASLASLPRTPPASDATRPAASAPPPPPVPTPPLTRPPAPRRKADAFGAPTERLRAGDIVARFVFRDEVIDAQLARQKSESATDPAVTPGVLAKLAARRRRRARAAAGGETATTATATVLATHAASVASTASPLPPPPPSPAVVTAPPPPPVADVAASGSPPPSPQTAVAEATAGNGTVSSSRAAAVGPPDGAAPPAATGLDEFPATAAANAATGARVLVDHPDGGGVDRPRERRGPPPTASTRRRQGLYQRIQAGRLHKMRKVQERRMRARKA